MKRLLPFIVLIVLFLAGIISVPMLLNPERHRKEITATLSQLVKRPVVVGSLSLGYWPPTVEVQSLAVMKEEGQAVLQVESAALPLSWLALVHLKLTPVELRLNHWTLIILRKADGTWDLGDWFSGIPELPNGKTPSLQRVRWTDGHLRWVDRFGAVPQELVLGDVEGRWTGKDGSLTANGSFSGLSSTARLSLNLKGQFFTAPQWAGVLQLSDQGNTCTLQMERRAGVVDIKGGAARWGLANAITFLKFFARGTATTTDSSNAAALENWQFHIFGNPEHFSFEHVAGISGGITELKGTIDAQPIGMVAHLEGAIKDLPAPVLWVVAGEDLRFSGKLTGVVKDVELVLSSQTLSTLKGEGYGELNAGAYAIPETSTRRLTKAKTMTYLKNKFPDLIKSGLPVSRLSAHWRANKGLLVVEDGTVSSTDLKASWAGDLDLDRHGLDVYVRLQLSEKDPSLLSLIPTTYRTRPAFGHLQGQWIDWSLKSIRPSRIPSGTQSRLRRAINQK